MEAIADEERDDEQARSENTPQDLPDVRFLFPKRLAHLSEDSPPAQFIGVLVRRRGRLGVDHRAMPDEHQRGV